MDEPQGRAVILRGKDLPLQRGGRAERAKAVLPNAAGTASTPARARRRGAGGGAGGPVDARRYGVLVLGMHRSGTSALARMLNLLGCDLPQDLMAANIGNAQGHWESNAVVQVNEALLASAGSRWDDWLPLHAGWYASPLHGQFMTQAREVLRAEFGRSQLFVMKDPRNCRLAPFWLAAMAAEGVVPLVAVPLRNPVEVADSLAARDGMDGEYALLLWLRHALDAEFATRGQLRVFLSYEQMLEDWQAVASRMQDGLGVVWPRRSLAVDAQISGFLSPAHRHHVCETGQGAGHAGLSLWVRECYAVMLRWAQTGEEPADWAVLDAIRTGFDSAGPSFAPLVAANLRSSQGVGAAARERADLARQLAQAQAQLVEAEAAAQAAAQAAAGQAGAELAAAAQASWQAGRQEGEQQALLAAAQSEAAQAAMAQRLAQVEAELAQAQSLIVQAQDQAQAQSAQWSGQEETLAQALAKAEQALAASRADGAAQEAAAIAQVAGHQQARRDAEVALHAMMQRVEAAEAGLASAQNEAARLDEAAGQAGAARDEWARRLGEAEAEALLACEAAAQARHDAAQWRAAFERIEAQYGEVAQALAGAEAGLAERTAQLAVAQAAGQAAQDRMAQMAGEREQAVAMAEARAEAQAEKWAEAQAEKWATQIAQHDQDRGLHQQQLAKAREDLAREQRLRAQFVRDLEQQASVQSVWRERLAERGQQLAGLERQLTAALGRVADGEAALADERQARARAERDGQEQALAAAELRGQLALRTVELARLTGMYAEAEAARAQAQAQAEVDAQALTQAGDRADRYRAEAAQAVQAQAAQAAAAREAVAQQNAELAQVRADLAHAQTQLAEANAGRAQAEARTAAGHGELAALTLALAAQAEQAGVAAGRAEWLRNLCAGVLAGETWWQRALPGAWADRRRRARLQGRLQAKGLFDAEAYLARNPDVAGAGMDPLRHFILHGMREGRGH